MLAFRCIYYFVCIALYCVFVGDVKVNRGIDKNTPVGEYWGFIGALDGVGKHDGRYMRRTKLTPYLGAVRQTYITNKMTTVKSYPSVKL